MLGDRIIEHRHIAMNLQRDDLALGIAQIAPVWRHEAGVQDGELQEAAGAQGAKRLGHHLFMVRHVHQRHEGGGEIEAGVGER